ncbi:MAG: glycosyltransferase family 4 protein [Acetobacteraceae bacterium]|nr:glycosyltransferase family 4 protein [Acetobacteraceae bacterium]
MRPDLLLVGGEDHDLRLPFMLALRDAGFRIAAAGTGSPAPFAAAAIPFLPFRFDRFINPAADGAAVAQLAGMLAKLRPRLVQCFDTKPNLLVPFAARRIAGLAVVRTINGLGWMFSVSTPLALALRPVFATLHRIAARSTTATVFQNREDRDFFERRRMLGQSAAYLIPGSGVDIRQFERGLACGPAPDALRRELGLGDAPVVMTVARLTRQKGIPTLLEAAARVHAVRPEVRFVLVGGWETEGPLAVTAAEIASHQPYVVATGKRADVPSLLRIADLFAFPTEYREGIPRALMEAGLSGLPLIATRMPGCTDVVRDGETGRLVPPRDPQALADCILGLLAQRQAGREMGSRAARLVRAEFGLDLTVARYAHLYSTVLGAFAAAPLSGETTSALSSGA